MTDKPESEHPLVVVLGIDPTQHEMPPLLHHHLSKMAKDIPIVFWAKEDMDNEAWKRIQELVEKTNFIPKLKSRIIKPNAGTIIKP